MVNKQAGQKKSSLQEFRFLKVTNDIKETIPSLSVICVDDIYVINVGLQYFLYDSEIIKHIELQFF